MSGIMKDLSTYNISYKGLKVGTHHFEFNIDNAFFEHFEYNEFNAVNTKIAINFEKKSTLLELEFIANGVVNVNCDLTNEPYDQPIEDRFNLVVKFGEEFNDENENILILPHSEFEINVAQYIYELIVLAVPLKRIHPGVEDGTLDSDVLKKLEELSPENQDNNINEDTIDPRWDNLKKLLTDK